MMKNLVGAALILLVSGLEAPGQTVSDIELQAAYCLGVTTEQEEETRRKQAGATQALKVLHERIAGIIAERRMRFRDYLVAKGFLTDRDSSAIKLAIVRGPRDVKTCEREIEVHPYKTCTDGCSRFRDDDRRADCVEACPSPDACVRVKRCLDNFLPF
jgi:hypothetical protein